MEVLVGGITGKAISTLAIASAIAAAISVAGAVNEARSQATSSDTQAPMKLSVFTGNEARIGRFYTALADCSSGPRPDTRVVKPPVHGTVRAEEAQLPADERAGSPRERCSGKLMDGTRFTYKSNDGFVGEDTITIDVDYKTGHVRRFNWVIEVR